MITRRERNLARRLSGSSQLERVRAARAMIEATGSETLALRGFLAIFHPEIGEPVVRTLVRDVKKNRR